MTQAHEGRSSTSIKFSDGLDWLSSVPQPRADLDTIPFIGAVSHYEVNTARFPEEEARRRDIGRQRYGTGTPIQDSALTDRHGLVLRTRPDGLTKVDTSSGAVMLTSHRPTDGGFLPTADAVNFLRDECAGSRFGAHPARYFQ